MNRSNFYFGQPVTEGELDQAFDDVEEAFGAFLRAFSYQGITRGAEVAENSPANLTVVVTPGTVYDQTQRHIEWFTNQVVNCALDELGAATTVTTVGQQKWLSIFAQYQETLSDPRTDESNATVYYRRTEGFKLNVVQSAQAVSATRPPLRGDQILIADVLIEHGQTQIEDADIDVTRAQLAYDLAGSPTAIRERNLQDVLQEMLNVLNGFEASSIAVDAIAGSPASIGAGTIQAALASLITYLNGLDAVNVDTDAITMSPGAFGYGGYGGGSVQNALEGLSPIFQSADQGAHQILKTMVAHSMRTAAQISHSVDTGANQILRGMASNHSLLEGAWGGNPGERPTLVVVGDAGTIYASVAGGAWTQMTPGSGYVGDFNSVIFVNGVFIAVGSGGEIQTSPDGVTWTRRATGGGDLYAIAGSTDTSVIAVGAAGLIKVSVVTPYSSWTTATGVFGAADLVAVACGAAYGNDVQHVVAAAGGGIQSSPSGSTGTWTSRNANGSAGTVSLGFHRKTGFVHNYNAEVRQSNDGVVWMSQPNFAGGSPGLVVGPYGWLFVQAGANSTDVVGQWWPVASGEEHFRLCWAIAAECSWAGLIADQFFLLSGDQVHVGGCLYNQSHQFGPITNTDLAYDDDSLVEPP